MNAVHHVRGLRVPRLDRVLDALAGRPAVAREPRLRRPVRRAGGEPLQLGLRFLPTV
ncbi:MAG TPA: hypothetical protein VFU56_07595 [Gaiellaceae bacterium]|nr:hypothetical protein [Gaiellaceae bacterium]